MTMYFIGLAVLRLLLTAIFFMGIYKIFQKVSEKRNIKAENRESRGVVILKERLASGEINEEKYRAMAAVIAK